MNRILNNIKNHNNWLAYYVYKYFKNKHEGFVFKNRSGLSVDVPKRMMQTYKECFFDECYFKGLPSHVLKQPVKTAVDIGANVGYFSLFLLSKYPKATIFAYEPIPNNFELLQQYQRENKKSDFHIFNQAVSDDTVKSITLNYDASDAFTTNASIRSQSHLGDTITVNTTSLEAIFKTNKLEYLDFLKLDCEGAEYDILYSTSNSILKKIKIIALETHELDNNKKNKKGVVDFLTQEGFQLNHDGDMVWAWRKG